MNPSTTTDMHLNLSPSLHPRVHAGRFGGARLLKALAFLVTAALLITSSAEAKRPRPTPAPDAASGMQKITEVNALSIKLAVGTAGDMVQSYSITDSTKVTLNGAPANARDLKAGMIAKVEVSADGRTAVTINAQDAPAHPGRNRTG
jgi:hypothetical protein